MCVMVNLRGTYTWLDLFLELVGNMSIGALGFWVKFELAIWARYINGNIVKGLCSLCFEDREQDLYFGLELK